MREDRTGPWEGHTTSGTSLDDSVAVTHRPAAPYGPGERSDGLPLPSLEGASRSEPMRVCINTQTPLLQFAPASEGPHAMWELEPEFSRLREGVDYRFSPGGVTRMVFPLAKRLLAAGVWKDVHWVALNPNAPETVRVADGITLHHLSVDRDRLEGYGRTKETLWSKIHGVVSPAPPRDLFWTDEYSEYAYYNRATAELIRELDRKVDFDAFYIHDFQQLPVGQMLGTLKPKLFRWHIPFDARRVPRSWQPLISTYLNAYDVVVVSSDRYRAALRRFGHRGPVSRLYPYVDPDDYGDPSAEEQRATCERFRILPDDDVVLVVARMDPAKAQDRAIEAVGRLRRPFPHLRLVLAGNGSFSSNRTGLGLSTSDAWRRHLEEVADRQGVSDRVVFTGHVSQRELECLYRRCAFTLLPSLREGFGLVVVESWLYGKPTVVSRRAGVADLVDDGRNGLLFDPEDPVGLDRAMAQLLHDRGSLRERLSRYGRRTAQRCSLDAAVRGETRLFRRVREG